MLCFYCLFLLFLLLHFLALCLRLGLLCFFLNYHIVWKYIYGASVAMLRLCLFMMSSRVLPILLLCRIFLSQVLLRLLKSPTSSMLLSLCCSSSLSRQSSWFSFPGAMYMFPIKTTFPSIFISLHTDSKLSFVKSSLNTFLTDVGMSVATPKPLFSFLYIYCMHLCLPMLEFA